MTRDLNALQYTFRTNVRELIIKVRERGHDVVPFQTLRDPFEQAKTWRRTRGKEEIMVVVDGLREKGCEWLADCIIRVGPQYPTHGSRGHLTRALPGQSWHQWGEAMDGYMKTPDGSAIWDAGHEGYRVYAEEAKKLNLSAGLFWPKFKDAVHVQARLGSVVLVFASRGGWSYVDREMAARFGS